MKATFQPIDGTPEGVVAYLRLPLVCSAMMSMDRFIKKAYGKDCVADENPKGWLRVQTNPTVISKEN